MSHINILAGPTEVARAAADLFVKSASAAIASHGKFSVALSGGTTPRLLYDLLATPGTAKELPWEHIHVFWGDERAVPPDHPDSNYRAAREALLDRVPIPPENVNRIFSELDPRLAASQYEETLRAFFTSGHRDQGEPGRGCLLDLTLLGMGGDGHTASLFPRTVALVEKDRWVVGNYVEQLATWRITLTAPFINRSKQVVFLVTGSGKKSRLQEVLEGPAAPHALPAQLIDPVDGELFWLVDEAAGALLAREGGISDPGGGTNSDTAT